MPERAIYSAQAEILYPMTISMKTRTNTSCRSGIALLIVLFIVMAITITALGFVARSDVEMLCGQNMVMRRQMDCLAESGLEHARGLLLNPQDVAAPDNYWKGGPEFRLQSGSRGYYDVTVGKSTDTNDHCTYTIDCNSYYTDGLETARWTRLQAQLRLDPCIAYWVNSSTAVSGKMNVTGDVYCNGDLTNSGTIDGDVFATHLSGTISGQWKAVSEAGVAWPNLTINDLGPSYKSLDPNSPLSSVTYNEVCYSAGDLKMAGNVTINGTLVVGGKLTVSGSGNVITAPKNLPALIVTGQVVMEQGSVLVVNGLAQIGQGISDSGATSASVQVTGALFVQTGGVSNAILATVIAAPELASIATPRWGPASGAFFKSIKRITP